VAKQSPHPPHSPKRDKLSGKKGKDRKVFARAGADEFKSEHSPGIGIKHTSHRVSMNMAGSKSGL
jgi:hypothetical protein